MKEFLLFRLYGPMAAWGDIAVGEQRPSHGHPTKSAIIGLLAAALGIRRDEEDKHNKLYSELNFATRIDVSGEILRDYHTTQVPSQGRNKVYYTRKDELSSDNLNTILSQRDYRIDACYTIAVWLTDESSGRLLREYQDALREPIFTLYLGRKSCPLALPLSPKIVSDVSLKQAFECFPLYDEMLQSLPSQEMTSYYWEKLDLLETGFPVDALHWVGSRRDGLLSRKRWQFNDREEHYLSQAVGSEQQ